MKTENLHFRTDLRDQVMNVWSVIQKMIIVSSRLLKNIELKLKLVQSITVYAGFYMALCHGISIATDLAATLVVINSESCKYCFSAFARRNLKLLCCSIEI